MTQGARRVGRPRGVLVRGDVLRKQREAKRLTRDQVAELAGLTTRTVQKVERGGRVSAATAHRLSEVLGLPILSVLRPRPEEVQTALAAFGRAPASPPHPWVPREGEVATLERWLLPDGPEMKPRQATARRWTVACIAGRTGIGKTALAQYLAASLAQRFPSGVVWVTASPLVSPTLIHGTQRDIAQALGFAGRLPQMEHMDAREFDLAFRHHFWSENRLLVLDDVVVADTVEHFASREVPGCVLITTRLRHVAALFEATALELEGVPEAVAFDMLGRYLDSSRLKADPAGTQRLIDLLGGSPGNLRIAGRVLQREIFTTPRAYAERLAAEPLALQVAADSAEPGVTLEPRDLTQIAAYCQVREHLSQGAWALFTHLGVFGERPFTPSWAAAAGGISADAAARYLSELADLYLVRPHAAEPTSDQDAGAPAARLDTHAVWLARALSPTADALHRLAAHAEREAKRLALLGPQAVWQSYCRHRPLWNLCLDAMVGELGVALDLDAIDDPEHLPDLVPGSNRLSGRLPETMLALEPLVISYRVPEVASWLPAAILVARASGRTGHIAQLRLAAGFWRGFSDHGPASGAAWHAETVERLVQAGKLLEAAGSCSAMSLLAAGLVDLDAVGAYGERALELARQAGLGGATLACFLNHAACSITRAPPSDPAWSRAVQLLEEALSECRAEDPAAAWVQAVSRANLALIRRTVGGSSAGDLEDAVRGVFDQIPQRNAILRGHLLAHAAHLGVALEGETATATAGRARDLVVGGTRNCTPEDVPGALWLLGADAYFLPFLSERRPDRRHLVAGGGVYFVPLDWTGRRSIPCIRGIEVGLILCVEPLEPIFDLDFIDLALRLFEDTVGPAHRTCTELQRLRELRSADGEPPESSSATG